MSITEAVLVGSLLFSIRNVWGHAYSNEKEVVDYVASMIPLLAASSLLDGIQGALSGSDLPSIIIFEAIKIVILES
jgi:MATE family multidrug resistance protein